MPTLRDFQNTRSYYTGVGVDLLGVAPVFGALKAAKTLKNADEIGDLAKAVKNAPNNAAHNASDAANLRNRLTAEEISGGHAFDKHVVEKGEFPGTTTRQQFAGQVEDVIRNHTHYRELSGGRVAFWDDATGTVVIRNPKAVDGSTAFKPTNGKTYFDGLK